MPNEIVMIPVDRLMHHPENPRKDLGDLQELSDSIKVNGVLQNLTIVPADGVHGKYNVVIGNRRLEAAILAGLTEVPCSVSDMDHKTQIATMLTENMQRKDLTVYEQAEGFQMMMDLGFKPKEIGEKTGFSEKTVKDRLKLTKLNKKNFGEAVNRGATLIDLVEITKLDSKTDQNEVMKVAGTDNFRATLNSKLRDQEYEKNLKRLEPVIKELLPELPESERYSSKWEQQWNDGFDLTGTEEDLKKHVQKLAKKTDEQIRYRVERYNGKNGEFRFYFAKAKAKTQMTAEEKTERQKSIARGKHLRHVKSFWAQAYELRKDFVKNYSPVSHYSGPTVSKILIRYALDGRPEWNGKIQDNHMWNDKYLREALGLPEEPIQNPKQDPDTPTYKKEYLTIWQQVEKKSEIPQARIMLAWAVAGGVFWPDAPERGSYRYDDGTYQNGSNMESDVVRLYKFLVEIGYGLSDMERQLLDGTHECYRMEDLG